MKRCLRILLIITLLIFFAMGTLSHGDVGNHNSFDIDSSDMDLDLDSGTGELASILKFIVIFIKSPWYVKLLLIGAIVWMVMAEKNKNKKMRKKYIQCDKSFIQSLDTTEEELKEIAKQKVLTKFGEKTKLDYIEIASFEKDESSHKITFLVKFHEAFRYVLLVLSHRSIDSGRYENEGFEVLSINDVKK